jgi:phosphoribosylaminoimidazole-succinocarboxamide synthase
MRPCSACVSRLILYQMSDASNYYVEYYRINRRYELASPMVKIKRLGAKADALREQSLKAERKAIRLRKQTRSLYKKIRKLDNRKNQNILDLKIEEKMEEAAKRTLNTPLDPSELPNSAPTLEFPPNLAGFS